MLSGWSSIARAGGAALVRRICAHAAHLGRIFIGYRVTADALDALGRADTAKAMRARYGVERKAS
jgi:hypothetical protein